MVSHAKSSFADHPHVLLVFPLPPSANPVSVSSQVPVEPLSISETLYVAKSRYPGLPSPALRRLLATMVTAKGGASGGGASGGGGFGLASRSAAGREPGVRDFLKLCARVEALGVFDGQGDGDGDEVGHDNRNIHYSFLCFCPSSLVYV